MNVRPVYLVAYGRSPYCKAFKGGLSKIHPVQFGGQTLAGVLQRIPQLKPEDIDDVVVGCAMPKGVQDYNIARLVAQRAGLPDRVPAMTINRFCSSSLQTVATAANTIACGQAEVIVAGGVESMSMVPMATDPNIVEPYLLKHAPDNYISMGMTAEHVAAEYHISREDMERMACESHRKAAQAQTAGWFEDQIIPVDGLDGQGNPVVLTVDEGIRPGTSMESLAQLKPCFKEDGVVTAGTSSQMTDGAGFVVLVSEEKLQELGVTPLAKFVDFAVDGVPARIMGIGPIKAIPKALKLAGLQLSDMDDIELNEAFASQALACVRTLGIPEDKLNPEGGAMALGHPLGASGAMLLCKAISHMRRCGGRYFMVTMCIGGGQGAAGIFEFCGHA